MAAASETACTHPHPTQTLPLLPPTVPFVATSLPFLAAFATQNTKRHVAAGGKPA
jgi:hypothetical protein